MTWWSWTILGIALLALEVVTPGGLVALFFGVAALVVAPLAALGLPPTLQWALFSIGSVASLALFRRRLSTRMDRRGGPIDTFVGEQAVLLTDVPAGGEGKAELRGSSWVARVASGIPLKAGQRCVVERVDGLTLYLRAI